MFYHDPAAGDLKFAGPTKGADCHWHAFHVQSTMQEYQWSEDKNIHLQKTRGISFEEIVAALDEGRLLGHIDHPTKLHQKIFIIEIKGYPWDIPYVRQPDGSKFLKTAFPNRKRK